MHSMWVITIHLGTPCIIKKLNGFCVSPLLSIFSRINVECRPYKERTLKLSNGGMPCEMAYERKSRSLLYTCLTTPESVEMYSWLLSTIWTLEISVQIEPAELEEPKKRLISISLAHQSLYYLLHSISAHFYLNFTKLWYKTLICFSKKFPFLKKFWNVLQSPI